jgi:hypothetical protein
MPSSPDRHRTRSSLEKALCEELRRQSVPHEHRSLHFRVHLPSGAEGRYEPDLVVRRGPILFLVEPLGDGGAEPERLELLAAFLDQHSPEIVLVLVGDEARLGTIPPACYDELYPASKLAAVVRRIRRQDPQGMVRPFTKPGGRTSL